MTGHVTDGRATTDAPPRRSPDATVDAATPDTAAPDPAAPESDARHPASGDAPPEPGTGLSGRLDAFQRRHRWAALPIAVTYKFVDDQGTYQAALLTYYGFVSLFPLLLLAVTLLGYVLAGDPAAQQAVLHSALRNVPVLGDQIGSNVHSLHGNLAALIVSLAVSIYGALGITQAMLTAMDQMWAVPVADRPSLPVAYGRGLVALLGLAVVLSLSTGLTALTTQVGRVLPPQLQLVVQIASVVLAIALNAGLFLIGFALLSTRRLRFPDLWPGAVVAAVGWQILQLVGAYLIEHELAGSTASYGLFGIVLGLMAWIYVAALVVLISVELNTVRSLGLVPRSLFAVAPADPDLTTGDRRAYTAYARTQRRKSYQRVDVRFDPESGVDPEPGVDAAPRIDDEPRIDDQPGTGGQLPIPGPRDGSEAAQDRP